MSIAGRRCGKWGASGRYKPARLHGAGHLLQECRIVLWHWLDLTPSVQWNEAAYGTIVYDGECPFCRAQISKIRRRAKDRDFNYIPRQDAQVLKIYPELIPYEKTEGLRMVSVSREVFIGADAVHAIFRHIWPHTLVAWTYQIPGLNWFFRLGYAWIAKNRLRLSRSCTDENCEVTGER